MSETGKISGIALKFFAIRVRKNLQNPRVSWGGRKISFQFLVPLHHLLNLEDMLQEDLIDFLGTTLEVSLDQSQPTLAHTIH